MCVNIFLNSDICIWCTLVSPSPSSISFSSTSYSCTFSSFTLSSSTFSSYTSPSLTFSSSTSLPPPSLLLPYLPPEIRYTSIANSAKVLWGMFVVIICFHLITCLCLQLFWTTRNFHSLALIVNWKHLTVFESDHRAGTYLWIEIRGMCSTRLGNKLVPCSWLSSGALKDWRLR